MFFYTAYNLGIHSQIPLPCLLTVAEGPRDVSIQLRTIDELEKETPRNSSYFLGETPGIGMFLVHSGTEIIVESAPGTDALLMSALLLGPIMAVLLQQRGFAVLHASSIATSDGVVAFLGDSGSGKSTIAEAFYSRGYGVMTDDVMAVHLNGSNRYVLPGYTSIKLFPETASFLGRDGTDTKLVHSQTVKRSYSVALRLSRTSLPLRQMYVLAEAESDAIDPLQPQEVFQELVRNSRAVTLLRDPNSRNVHLHQCIQLAANVPVFRLRRRRVLSCLPELIRLIEQHIA